MNEMYGMNAKNGPCGPNLNPIPPIHSHISHARCFLLGAALLLLCAVARAEDAFPQQHPGSKLQPLYHNVPGLVTDLGVGLWGNPLPCDYDRDGDNDLLVACPDVPYNGVYFFENTSGDSFPVFKPGEWLCPAKQNMTISYTSSGWEIMQENRRFARAANGDFNATETLTYEPTFHLGRDKQWKRYDYDGDGVLDLIIGASDWRDYGWDNAFNAQGEWTHGPLHAYVYFVKNTATNEAPQWSQALQLQAGEKPLDVYGAPSPNFGDWDGDGDLDLVCGEFLDSFTYFENIGTRTQPRYTEGRKLTHDGTVIRMDLEMLQVVAFDWDKDADLDLIVGQEDGRVAWMECLGIGPGRTPQFSLPRFFKQEAARVKVGALCTPVALDWDGDGDQDLIVGNTAGYVDFVENLGGGDTPKWAAPAHLQSGGRALRIQAGPNGSIQGPAEAKWGYTVPEVADWDGDGLPDLIINSIWGKVEWFRNPGPKGTLELESARPVEAAWEGPAPKPAWNWWNPEGNALVTQWRTRPIVRDLNNDGLNDLIMLDTEGYLAFFERARREGALLLLPPKRIFLDEQRQPLRLNERAAGRSGRRKLTLADWDGDGRLDLLVDSKSIDFWRNIGDAKHPYVFKNEGPVDPCVLAGHDTCPAIVDWNHDGRPDLLIGAEDGFLYYLDNPKK